MILPAPVMPPESDEVQVWVAFIAAQLSALCVAYDALQEERRREAATWCLSRVEAMALGLWGPDVTSGILSAAVLATAQAKRRPLEEMEEVARVSWLAAGSASLALAVAYGMDLSIDPAAEAVILLAADCCRAIRRQSLEPLSPELASAAARLRRGSLGNPAVVVGAWLA